MKKAIIISLKGKKLSYIEKRIIKEQKPWGIILFKRNIANLKQIRNLISDIKKTSNDKKFPILIDEEGGAVSRLRYVINFKNYSQKYFGDLFDKNRKNGFLKYKKHLVKVINLLKNIKININTVPVLDLLDTNTSKIIGSRSFSKNINTIKKLGKLCVSQFKKNRISCVIKHIPGHGCANQDSHKILPVVQKKSFLLEREDFKCFKNVNSHFAMTAHILYKDIDSKNCATLSKKVINSVIRKKIGFKGILISDDISMKALKGDIVKNSINALNAGCNLVLYCAGNPKASLRLCRNLPYIDKFTQKKTSQFYKFLR